MKKILLTSGSSFSSNFLIKGESYPPVDNKFKLWPELLSEKLDVTLINNSKSGASNLYMFDHLMENIINYGNDIELVVAAWSYGFKTSIFRNLELNFISLDDQENGSDELIEPVTVIQHKLLSEDLLFSSIEQSMRLMLYLQDACDSKNIKCIHYPLLNLFKSPLDKTAHIELLDKITNSKYFLKIQEFDNTIGWPSDAFLGGFSYNIAYPDKVVSSTDHHPSEEGQKIIAQEIHDKYLKLKGTTK